MPLKYRILIIVGLCLASIYLLFPRDVATRYRGADGVLRVDTSRHVPLRRGLDLQGGMYLALEVDDSKQAIAASDKKEAIDRALKTVRSRIEGFGVSEPVVQKQGDDRIVVQLPGIQDPRAGGEADAESGLSPVQDHRQDAGARARPAQARSGRQAARPEPKV